MDTFTPILRAENPGPVECHNCGEGSLHFAQVRSVSRPGPRYAFQCDTCHIAFEDPAH